MIPPQLKNMKFCRVRYKTKKPFEKDWTNKPYTYEEISKHFPKENYGVLTGINQLGVLDDDTEDKQLLKIALEKLEETFRVRDHLYFKLKNWDGQKIIFYDSTGKHCGELQGLGQQVVGPGSIHPSGEEYDLRVDIPIKEIEFKLFKEGFKDYLPKPKIQTTTNNPIKSNWEGDDIKDIPITNVISLGGLNDMGNGSYQGSHPQHNSVGGMNFRVNTNSNTWYCFRCNSGGSSPELIGVMEGIIDCSQAGKGCYTGNQGVEVINIAREKYGLKRPEPTSNSQPMGWALSINIKTMAERLDMLNCPECKVPFKFKEDLGFYKCPSCFMFGGLKKFSMLCHNNSEVLHKL